MIKCIHMLVKRMTSSIHVISSRLQRRNISENSMTKMILVVEDNELNQKLFHDMLVASL
jgi:hypothetical protein